MKKLILLSLFAFIQVFCFSQEQYTCAKAIYKIGDDTQLHGSIVVAVKDSTQLLWDAKYYFPDTGYELKRENLYGGEYLNESTCSDYIKKYKKVIKTKRINNK